MAALVISLMLVFPIAFMNSDVENYRYLFYGVIGDHDQFAVKAIPLATLLIFIPILNLAGIFFYKNRILQMRICIFNILLMLGSMGLIWFYSHQADKTIGVDIYFSFPAVLPLVGAILTYLAFMGIRKDEILIKSADRIR
jgi:uncharacterized membrane protein